ncbi:orotidine-5'-phosphate decarboxylase [Verrucosispora sp. WMMD703]|uniref:orotidine-5'-phosphate decarboxylase n=1 Tax=Verrucosispora sp. WMMD703 TaxID=3403463 RepID=UPI003B93939C
MGFYEMVRGRWAAGRLVCVGLDPDPVRLPSAVRGSDARRTADFCREIVDATHDYAAAFKLNSAFFEALGADGIVAMERVIAYIKDRHPSVLVIVDAKRGDIANTNEYYATAVFDTWGADVLTVHPYFGGASLKPFLRRSEKGAIVMGANSDPGATEFQDLALADGSTLFEHVCRTVAEKWNVHANCAVTAGANDPAKLARIRTAVGEMPILLLGIGAQGGDIDACLSGGTAGATFGLIVNSSRDILYASAGDDFADTAHRAASTLNARLASASTTRP